MPAVLPRDGQPPRGMPFHDCPPPPFERMALSTVPNVQMRALFLLDSCVFFRDFTDHEPTHGSGRVGSFSRCRGSGRVGSGHQVFEISRVRSARVRRFTNLTGRVGSGHFGPSLDASRHLDLPLDPSRHLDPSRPVKPPGFFFVVPSGRLRQCFEPGDC